MESGTPGVKVTDDGWLNRSLHAMPPPSPKSAFRGIALGPSLPRILSGAEPAVALNNINDFSIGGRNSKGSPAAHAVEANSDPSVDSLFPGTGGRTFDPGKKLKAPDPAQYSPAP